MAAHGRHRLAWQSGAFAKYAEASVEFDPLAASGMDLTAVSEPWRTAVAFGVMLLREKLSAFLRRDVGFIRVQELLWQPVDTTMMAAAYAAFHAAAKAVGVDAAEWFRFDEATGDFVVR